MDWCWAGVAQSRSPSQTRSTCSDRIHTYKLLLTSHRAVEMESMSDDCATALLRYSVRAARRGASGTAGSCGPVGLCKRASELRGARSLEAHRTSSRATRHRETRSSQDGLLSPGSGDGTTIIGSSLWGQPSASLLRIGLPRFRHQT